MIGIYKITNPNGLIYIGQGIDIHNRWKIYNSTKAPKQPKLRASFLEYGIDAHLFEVIALCEQKELNAIEIYYIDFYDSFKSGLNSCDERNVIPKVRKTKDVRKKEWQEHLEKQRLKYLSTDFEREKRLKKLRYDRSKRF